jgi:ATP-dependent Lhr-like helicase
LIAARRAALVDLGTRRVHIAVERLPELAAVTDVSVDAMVPPSRRRTWSHEAATVELLRGRAALVGPTTAAALGEPLGLSEAQANAALEVLESEGVVLRGKFHPDARALEWCERTLLARIHRYTLNRLRAEIEPVTPAVFMRFLFDWQHVGPVARASGLDGLLHVVRTLDGFELPAAAWEASVLPCRLAKYDASWLDMLCLTGQVGWARVSKPQSPTRMVRTTAIALFLREHADTWLQLAAAENASGASRELLSTEARAVLEMLMTRGALFAHEIASACSFDAATVRHACAELVSLGLVASDGFAGLRSLLAEKDTAPREMSGRWYACTNRSESTASNESIEFQARTFLRRYGVVCRRVIAREPNAQPWRVLARVYRTLEARGEIRGGRFVAGLAGEQFALPEAVERLREIRRTPPNDQVLALSAADPLNLAGIVTAGDRVPAVATTRIAYHNGVPLAVLEGDYIRPLTEFAPDIAADVASALTARRMPPIVSGFVGRVS